MISLSSGRSSSRRREFAKWPQGIGLRHLNVHEYQVVVTGQHSRNGSRPVPTESTRCQAFAACRLEPFGDRAIFRPTVWSRDLVDALFRCAPERRLLAKLCSPAVCFSSSCSGRRGVAAWPAIRCLHRLTNWGAHAARIRKRYEENPFHHNRRMLDFATGQFAVVGHNHRMVACIE